MSLVKKDYSVNPPNVYGFGHKAYYDHVVNVIQKKHKPLIDGAAGRKSLKVINSIYESIERNKEIYINYESVSKLGKKN